MQVYMKNFLPGSFAIRQKEINAFTAQAALIKCLRQPLACLEHTGAGCIVQLSQVAGVPVRNH